MTTPPIQHQHQHQHHTFHSPHSAFSSLSSNNVSYRGMPRSISATPNSMMGPPLHHQEMVRQSPIPFHPMQSLNHVSPHPRTTPIPEIHPASYPHSEHHFVGSPSLSCPVRESPHSFTHNLPQQESLPAQMPAVHTLCYTQPPIYNSFKPHVPAHPQTCRVQPSCRPTTPADTINDSSTSNQYPQASTPIIYSSAVSLPQSYPHALNSTESTSSQPSLESIEFESEVDTARTSIDESTANLVISAGDELSDLKVSPAPLPFSVVVTSIATSSHDNLSESASNFPYSPTCLSPHSSKFPLIKERKAMDKKMRREIANCNERKRMENINTGFRTLKVLLPQSQNEKTSKAAILQQTAKYIHRLVEEKRRLIEENDKVKHELSKYMSNSQYGIGKGTAFIQPGSGFQPFSSSAQISKPEADYCSRMQEEVSKLQDQLKHERNSKCMLEKINRDLESRVGFMESVCTHNPDPMLASRDAHCKQNVDAILMSLELETECYPNRPPSPLSGYERQTPYVEIMDRSTTPYIDRNTPVGHFRAIKSPMPHH